MHYRLLLMATLITLGSSAQDLLLFAGTYTNTGSKGIYVYRFNTVTGKATLLSNTDSAANPSYLAVSHNKKFLYAVNETHGDKPGSVSSYAINAQSGSLKKLNTQATGGDDPCYVAVHKNDQWIAVANYSGGSASVFKVGQNGMLKPYAQLMQHTGKGTNPSRQEKPHVHASVFSPDYQYLFTPDLGLDQVKAYKFNPASARPITAATPSFITTKPGSGPRHLTFHPNNRFAYLIEELSGMVSVFKYQRGKLTSIQRIAAHPTSFTGKSGSADIHVSPDGKFLYASNRGEENNIALFKIDPTSGRLQPRGYEAVLGKTPRNFVIDPSGNFLLVANQGSDNVVVFKRNKQTGQLTSTGFTIDIPRPVCLKLM